VNLTPACRRHHVGAAFAFKECRHSENAPIRLTLFARANSVAKNVSGMCRAIALPEEQAARHWQFQDAGSIDHGSAGMTQDKRRRIVEQVIQRLDASGMAFETDPQFLSAMNDWIAGTIEMPQLRQRFLDLLQERQSAVRIRYALPPRPPEKAQSTLAGITPLNREHAAELRQEEIEIGRND
jgi:hypothetical protein